MAVKFSPSRRTRRGQTTKRRDGPTKRQKGDPFADDRAKNSPLFRHIERRAFPPGEEGE